MKAILYVIPFALFSNVAMAALVQKTGTIDLQPLAEKIHLQYDTEGYDAQIQIENVGKFSAIVEGTQISGYPSKPRKFFYFTLELNPRKGDFGSESLVTLNESGSGYSGCRPGTNAILTGYKGDGTSQRFCVTLK